MYCDRREPENGKLFTYKDKGKLGSGKNIRIMNFLIELTDYNRGYGLAS